MKFFKCYPILQITKAIVNFMCLLTEWEGRRAKYLARGNGHAYAQTMCTLVIMGYEDNMLAEPWSNDNKDHHFNAENLSLLKSQDISNGMTEGNTVFDDITSILLIFNYLLFISYYFIYGALLKTNRMVIWPCEDIYYLFIHGPKWMLVTISNE